MQLHALRPKQGANLIQLRNLLDSQGWSSALPTALPDRLLLRLARDFRTVECSSTGRDTLAHEVDGHAAALMVVFTLLTQHPRRAEPATEMAISEERLARAMQIYQWGLEREIVNRIVGDAVPQDSETLIDELWQCANE